MSDIRRAKGKLRVERGRHPLARLLGAMLRLPHAGDAVDTRLAVTASAGERRWERTFDGRRLTTRQRASNTSELAERIGILEFTFHLDRRGGSVVYVQRDTFLVTGPMRVRIPAVLAPRVEAREDPAGPARIALDVRVTLPGIGLLIGYGGIIEVEDWLE